MMKELGATFTESDIALADKQRTRSMKIMESLFKEVDVILFLSKLFVLKATSSLPAVKTEYHRVHGFFEGNVFTHSTHYSSLSALTGIPALSLNMGYDSNTGLPMSLQIMTKWWREDLLLSVANALEKNFPLSKTPPEFQKIIE